MRIPATPTFFAIALAGLAIAPPASADVREVAARVAEQWRAAGARVATVTTRFLYDDEKMTIALPVEPELGCTSVALVGARGLSFRARIGGLDEDSLAEEPGTQAVSVAGVLQLERCDGEAISRVVVSSDAGRGAIETIVARSATPVPTLRSLLPERTGGVIASTPEPGALPPLAPPAKRAEFAEARARRDGATLASRETWRAGGDGTGDATLRLAAGCHRIELFPSDGRPGARKARVDVDAELRGEHNELLARDRTDAPDARLEACFGEESTATVLYAGAASGNEVLVTRATWGIPDKLPDLWGPVARARMARALLARHMAAPRADPVVLAQGAGGSTMVPAAVEPGACYAAVAAVTFGHPRGLGLRVAVGARDATDERGPSDDAGAVAFCVGDRRHVRIEVEARGSATAWGLALHRIEGRVWSGPR
jgi:hypothetical protein